MQGNEKYAGKWKFVKNYYDIYMVYLIWKICHLSYIAFILPIS